MKNTNRQPSSGSVLLGMAAGAALGAVGTMAMAQNQRQVKRTARKAGQGRGTRHEPAGYHGHGSRGAQDGSVRENKKAGPAGSAFLLAIYFWFQIHIRALVLISPRTCRSI